MPKWLSPGEAVRVCTTKWMLDDPRVNFVVQTRTASPGLSHFGIQVEDRDELAEVFSRLQNAGGPVQETGETVCCYAKSEKNWTFDPDGLFWEAFLTTGEAAVYGTDEALAAARQTARQSRAGLCC